MASYDGSTHEYDESIASLDAYPAGEGYDLLLCGFDNDTQWLMSDTHVDVKEER